MEYIFRHRYRSTNTAATRRAASLSSVAIGLKALFLEIKNHALYFVENGNDQDIADIATTAWACATLGIQCPALFQAIDNNAGYLHHGVGLCNTSSRMPFYCSRQGVLRCRVLNGLHYSRKSKTTRCILSQKGRGRACGNLGIECPSIKQNTIFLVENGQPKAIVHLAWASAKQWIDCPCNR